jgi:PAS domain S-box-containing protein
MSTATASPDLSDPTLADVAGALAEVQQRDRLLHAVIGSISAHVVVLDRRGTITYTGRSWLEFAKQNDGDFSRAAVGANYLEACRQASGNEAEAAQALDGIAGVLSGKFPRFSMEYACHTTAGASPQWFLLHVDPMPPEHGGVVITHTDITHRRLVEEENQRLVHELSGHVKELSTLYSAAQIFQHDNHTTEQWLEELAALLPRACQFPSISAARIWLGDLERKTPEFTQTPWMMKADFTLANGRSGGIEVAYLYPRPTSREDASINEEQNLIQCVAEMLHWAADRRQSQEALRESEERYRGVIESQTELVCRFQPDCTLTFVNEAYCRYFGRTREQLIGTSFLDLIPEAGHEPARKVIRTLVENPTRAIVAEHEVLQPDGTIGWQHWVDHAVLDDAGRIVELQAIGRDITDRKHAEDSLKVAVEELRRLKDKLQAENIYLQQELSGGPTVETSEQIICESASMKKLLADAARVARTNTTVLVLGETGTGKELIARAVHRMSNRKDKPLVRCNCASLPGNLIESELFGHERGAFTGANARRVGRFEVADGGTIFLDEIGELPLELQAKLLRVLQDGEFERLGNSRTFKVDVRVIAATNRDLGECVKRGTFRADLYYRLNVFPLHLAPLRQRREAIASLAAEFLRETSRRLGRQFHPISHDVLERLRRHDWPGNVRELQNVIERAALTSAGQVLQLPEGWEGYARATAASTPAVPVGDRGDGMLPRLPSMRLEELERAYILQVLERMRWRIEGPHGAAGVLGMNASTLRSRMAKLGIQRISGSVQTAHSTSDRHAGSSNP